MSETTVALTAHDGKKADMVLLDIPSFRYLPYHYGVNLVDRVVKDGRVVVDRGRRI